MITDRKAFVISHLMDDAEVTIYRTSAAHSPLPWTKEQGADIAQDLLTEFRAVLEPHSAKALDLLWDRGDHIRWLTDDTLEALEYARNKEDNRPRTEEDS